MATIVLSSPWTSAELVADAVLSEARAAFAEEPWSYAPWGALAGMGLAGIMLIAERIAMRQPARKAAPRPLPGKGLDAAIAERINGAVKKALEDPNVQKRMAELGNTPRWESVAQFKATVAADRKAWAEVVKASGASID